MSLGAIRPRETAHQACEQALRRAVIAGELVPGQRLPPERELAATLGVSRLTLRAALAALTARGLLAVRQGSGYVVQDFTRRGGADLLPDLDSDSVPIAAELLRVRRHLARAVLEHLAEHPPTATAVKKFDAAVDAMAALVETARPTAELAAADLDVVRALVATASTPVLGLCLNPLIHVIETSPRLRDAIYAEPAGNVAGWRTLATWLRRPRRETLDSFTALLETRDAASLDRLRRRRSR